MPNSQVQDEVGAISKEFFGTEIAVANRARVGLLEAARLVDLFGIKIAITGLVEVFSELVHCSPACCDVLAKEELPLHLLPVTTRAALKEAKLRIRGRTDCRSVLSAAFEAHWPNKQGLNGAGELVKRSGLLTEVDLVAGILESARSALTPSPVLDVLLKPLGLLAHGLPIEKGEKLLASIERQFRCVGNIDPSHFNQQFLLFLDDKGKFRVRPFGATALGLTHGDVSAGGPFIFRGGAIQEYSRGSSFGSEALEELESMINSPRASEGDFQRFFEQNPDLLTGIDYDKAHPHPILHKDDGSSLIPDFFMEKLDSGWNAILDLKLPKEKLVVRRTNRTYFAQWIQEAIAQLQYYREWFDEPGNCRDIERRLGLASKVFRPRLVLVAGRARSFQDEVERVRLLSNGPRDFDFWTYDELAARARKLRKLTHGEL